MEIPTIVISLNRAPYLCPVLEDHRGEKGHYLFSQGHIGLPLVIKVLDETDQYWDAILDTMYQEDDGSMTEAWIRIEIMKECFDVQDIDPEELEGGLPA